MGKSFKKENIVIAFIFIFFFLSIMVCGSLADQKTDDMLIISAPIQPISLDPGTSYDDASLEVCGNIYETLVEINPKTGQVLPCLAVDWSSDYSYTVWNFTLRKNVRFSDGTPFDSSSVKFAFSRQMDAKNPYHFVRYGNFSYYAAIFGGFPGILSAVNTRGAYAVEFVFTKPVPDLLKILALPQFSIPSPGAVKERKEEFFKNPAGTGPYKMASWNYDSRMVLVRNNNYWGGKPQLNRIIIQIIPDHDQRLSLLKKDYSEIMMGVEVDDYYRLKNQDRYGIIQYPYASDVMLGINCQRYPFNDRRVREALGLILSQDILGLISLFEPDHNKMNYKELFHREKNNYPNYLKAQKKLSESGHEVKEPVELIYPQGFPLYASETDLIAVKLKFLLNGCGFKDIRLKALPWDKYNRSIDYGRYDLALVCTNIKNSDERLFCLTYFNQVFPAKYGLNKFHWYSKILKSILADIAASGGTYSEKSFLEEMNYYIYENTPYVFLGRLENKIIALKYVKGISFDNNGYLRFDKIYIR